MFLNFFSKRINDLSSLFNGHFIEAKSFYALRFNSVPSISFISELDITKAFAYIDGNYRSAIVAVYQHTYFDHTEKKIFFNNTIFILRDKRMIELSSNYCQVLHTSHQYAWANQLVGKLAEFRMTPEPAKENRIVGFATQPVMS